jgi:hypothetical protein
MEHGTKMNNSQTIIFTAIPRGVSWNTTNANTKTLPVSVFISPRLSGQKQLSAYPDWLDWTSRRNEFGLSITFECSGNTRKVELPRDKLRPDLWTAIFKKGTLVDSYEFDDYSDRFISSYPVRAALSSLKATYQAAGISLAIPSADYHYRGDFPGSPRRILLKSLLAGYDVNWTKEIGEKWRKEQIDEQRHRGHGTPTLQNQTGSDTLLKTGSIKALSTASADLHKNVVQRFAVFNHIPPGTPVTRGSVKDDTVLDFHKALTSLNNYPVLQRMLGLVFDIELPVEFISLTSAPNPGMLKITNADGHWDNSTTTIIPTTTTAYIHTKENGYQTFATAPRVVSNQTEPDVLGLLNLDPSDYGMAQVDVDGSLNKTIILAGVMASSDPAKPPPPPHPEVFDPTTTLPYIRSAGFSIFADDRAMSLLSTFGQSSASNQGLGTNNIPPLFAEDLVRGYRLDIWSGLDNKWHSLHLRNGKYSIGELENHKDVMTEGEEGFVQLSVTQAAPNADGTQSSNDLYLSETIARWAGWSLSSAMPGKHLTRSADPDKALPSQTDPDPENEPITPFKVITNFKVLKNSLPRLRFGNIYRLRMRVVDLAGNSIKLDEPVTDHLTLKMSLPRGSDSVPYLRFEPIVAPYIVLRDESDVTGNGSSMDRIVIRTFNSDESLDGISADLAANDRHIAPPRVSIELAEQHGMFDNLGGNRLNSDEDMWHLIKQRDEGKFQEVKVVIGTTGNAQSVPLEKTSMIDKLPYLPDPLARGAALRNLPGTLEGTFALVEPGLNTSESTIKYDQYNGPSPSCPWPIILPRPGSATLIGFNGKDDWQKVVPFRIALEEGEKSPMWNSQERLLTIFLPKAQTKVIPMSCYTSSEDLKLMGVWQWLREYVEYITTSQDDLTDQSGKSDGSFYQEYGKKDNLVQILQLAEEGGHWMLTPPHLITLVHAVQQPIGRPEFTRLETQYDPTQAQQAKALFSEMPVQKGTASSDLNDVIVSWRELPSSNTSNPGSNTSNSTDAYLIGALQVHGESTAKVDLRAKWTDDIDDPSDTEYHKRKNYFSMHVAEIPLNTDKGYIEIANQDLPPGYYDPAHDLICFVRGGSYIGSIESPAVTFDRDAAPKHQIGDTKYHLIEYTAVSTSRYREYFPQNQDARFTRESKPAKVHVPASTRPTAPQIVYVIPTFGWQRDTHTNITRSFRMGGGLRIYMNRPWFSSGSGELLGVTTFSRDSVIASTKTTPSTTTTPTTSITTTTTTYAFNPQPYSLSQSQSGSGSQSEDWKSFVTQWGQDPIWQSAQLDTIPDYTSFPDADTVETGIELGDPNSGYALLSNGNPRLVDVAGYRVEFDDVRKLWYCDITVDTKTISQPTRSATYSPFVRLALVRYQPHALKEAKVSHVVLADFAQLTSERAVTVTTDPYHPGEIRVIISGPAPTGPRPAFPTTDPQPTNPVDKPLQITVTLQERDPSLQSDLAWKDASKDDYTLNIDTNNPLSTDPNLFLWSGSIHIIKRPSPKQHRILIQEHEYISADYTITTQGDNSTVVQPSRLIYTETVLLDEYAKVTFRSSESWAVSWGTGRLDVFGVGENNDLLHKWFDGSWSETESRGGTLGNQFLSAVSSTAGRLDVFGVGENKDLLHWSFDGSWRGPESLDAGMWTNSRPSAVSSNTGRLDVFGVGENNDLLHKWFDGSWRETESRGGTLFAFTSPSAVSSSAGRLDVFGVGEFKELLHWSFDGSWSEPESLDSGMWTNSKPTVVASSAGRLDVFGRGTDNELLQKSFDGSWRNTESLGGNLLNFTSQSVVASSTGRLDVFGVGENNGLLHWSFDGSWSKPKSLDPGIWFSQSG